jgi:RPA family protein
VHAKGKKISRANIMGVVVSKSGDVEYPSMVIDDGSEKISIKSFEQNGVFKKIDIGSIIMVIGRPKKYGQEIYILPEIIKEMSKEWLELRKKELVLTDKEETREDVPETRPERQEEPVKAPEENIGESKEDVFDADMLIEFIKKNDKGEGVDFKDMMQIDNAEKLVKRLLEEGDIFEIKPGVYKVLD